MKKKSKSKMKRYGRIISAWMIALVTATGAGVTYAYNQHSTEQMNLLKAYSVSGEVIENGNSVTENERFTVVPGTETEKRVQFKNTGTASVFVRVSFGETWTDMNGEWLAGSNTYAVPQWTSEWEEEWQLRNDSWYYYNQILKANTSTAEVLSSVGFPLDLPQVYANGKYQLFFTMEIVQYSNETAVNDAALQTVFGRGATVTEGVVTWN